MTIDIDIKEARRLAGITVTEAAAMADVSPTSWRIWEASNDAVRRTIGDRCTSAAMKIIEMAKRAA